MTPVKPKLRSPLKYHGGKSYLARRIIELMPEHEVYIEPFCGGCSVLLNKPRVAAEVCGDAYGAVINFWRTLQRDVDNVVAILNDVAYRREDFNFAKKFCENIRPDSDPLTWAVEFLVWNRMSRGGLGRDFAWSERRRGGMPGDVNAWDTMVRAMKQVRSRIGRVSFSATDARGLIFTYAKDNRDVLIYCDPPYLHETRAVRSAYAHEMSYEDHMELLALLRRCEGKVMLSGYDSPLYHTALKGWRCVRWDMANHAGQSDVKQRRIECLWMNFDEAQDHAHDRRRRAADERERPHGRPLARCRRDP
jgi:DNA adenine methylase